MKISDSLEIRDYAREREERKQKRTIAIIVLICISILIGVVTFLISNSILNNKKDKEEPVQDTILKLNDENVTILYQYVAHEVDGERYDKLVTNENITINDFKTEEKYYYALQFAQAEDFEFTGEKDKNKNKIYFISNKKIKEYMKLFFGANISYRTDMTIIYPFSFKINGMNIGTMVYNDSREGFDVIFDKASIEKETYKPFYTELESAVLKQDGTIVLREKILYTKVISVEDKYRIELYKDPKYGILIEILNDVEKDKINNFTVEMKNKKNTGIIEYTFTLDDNNIYYFKSSKYIEQ